MTRWEYTVCDLHAEGRDNGEHQLQDALNVLGAVGWELVSAVPLGEYVRYILKRQVSAL